MRKLIAALLLIAATSAQAEPFDPRPWLADLQVARQAFSTKYANLEWLQNEREIKIDGLFDDLATRMLSARNQEQARGLFERLVRKTGDGHVEIDWAEPPAPSKPNFPMTSAPPDACQSMGFDARQNGPGTAGALPGYLALGTDNTNPFRAGTTTVAGTKIGIIRIGVFQPQGFPELCKAAVSTLRIAMTKQCNDQCQDQITDWIYPRLTAALEDRARQLRRAGATVLLIDISGNGGGSEWAEAAARIFSGKKIVSERRGMVRGEHWAKQWRDLEQQLRLFAANASGDEKVRLLHWAADAASKLHEAETPCPTNASCKRIADAGFSAGLLGSVPAGAFSRKPWGPLIFSPAQFPYHDAVWSGPLVVLVDDATWSAAEEFTAVLQDNKAAAIMGARTGGAGCGHTNGGDPVILPNSHAVLKLPDCVRFRADGSNEVRGIIPDVPVSIRSGDGAHFRARLVAEDLPRAIALARRLKRMR
jgi:hypothetical protein